MAGAVWHNTPQVTQQLAWVSHGCTPAETREANDGFAEARRSSVRRRLYRQNIRHQRSRRAAMALPPCVAMTCDHSKARLYNERWAGEGGEAS